MISEHGAAPSAPLPGGRYGDHFSKHNGHKVKSPSAKTGELSSRTGAGEGNRTLDIQLGKLSFYH
jgi:hypothetical protein